MHKYTKKKTSWITRKNVIKIIVIPSGKLTKKYGKSPFSMGKSTISMVMFNSNVTNDQRVTIHWINCPSFMRKIIGFQFCPETILGLKTLPREISAFPAAEFRSQKVVGSQLESKFFESFQWDESDEFKENLQEDFSDFSVFLNVLHIFMVRFLQILHQSSDLERREKVNHWVQWLVVCQRFGVQ